MSEMEERVGIHGWRDALLVCYSTKFSFWSKVFDSTVGDLRAPSAGAPASVSFPSHHQRRSTCWYFQCAKYRNSCCRISANVDYMGADAIDPKSVMILLLLKRQRERRFVSFCYLCQQLTPEARLLGYPERCICWGNLYLGSHLT